MAVVDVGCGPGALTERSVQRVGAENVAAADPSEPFVAAPPSGRRRGRAGRRRGASVELGRPVRRSALPARVNFMRDADAGVGARRRVTRPGGVVAACTWSYGEDMTDAARLLGRARRLDSGAPGMRQHDSRYRSVEELEELWRRVGLNDVDNDDLPSRRLHRLRRPLGAVHLRSGPGRGVPGKALIRGNRSSCAPSSSRVWGAGRPVHAERDGVRRARQGLRPKREIRRTRCSISRSTRGRSLHACWHTRAHTSGADGAVLVVRGVALALLANKRRTPPRKLRPPRERRLDPARSGGPRYGR